MFISSKPKSHLCVCLHIRGASTSLPRHNSRGRGPPVPACLVAPLKNPFLLLLPPTAHLARLSLSLWQCPPPPPPPLTSVTVILAGSSLRAGASHGGSRFLNYGPDVWGRMGTQRGEGNYALTSFPLSPGGVSHLHWALRALWKWIKWLCRRWMAGGEVLDNKAAHGVPPLSPDFLHGAAKYRKIPHNS